MKISRRKLDVGVPSVAMADIAFNLVLFFIILARTQDQAVIRQSCAPLGPQQRLCLTGAGVA